MTYERAPMGPHCASCKAPIFWFKTKEKRLIPVDRQASPSGTIVLEGNEKCRVLSMKEAAALRASGAAGGAALFTAHFATCPNAAQHRRRRRAR